MNRVHPLQGLKLKPSLLLMPKIKLPPRIDYSLIKMLYSHALAFANHAHRLVVRNSAS